MTVHKPTELRLRDLPAASDLDREAARSIRGGLAKRGSPFAVSPLAASDFIPTWEPGPSIDDAANAGDDSAYYGLRPLR